MSYKKGRKSVRGKQREIRYEYHNAPIPGGGYVTGFVFQRAVEGLLYLRTDIGGTYRFLPDAQRWKSLCDHVTMEDKAETYPIAIAVEERHPERLYIASGNWREEQGRFSVSEDYGESFRQYPMPMRIHGNLPGRGTGYRLIVDRKDSGTLYFASQTSGLWRTKDRGEHWEKLAAMPEEYLTFVGQSPDGELLFVGAAGVSTRQSETVGGPALYASRDGGEHFEPLRQPEYAGPVDPGEMAGEEMPLRPRLLRGPVAQRYAVDDRYLYVTFACRCEAFFMPELGYSCDAGKVTDGHVVRYDLSTLDPKDITPDWESRAVPDYPGAARPCLHLGFSGIDICEKRPGLLICSTIRKSKGDSIYRSLDYGESWQEILHDLDIGEVVLRTSYMKPEYNSRHSMVHWMTDLKIDPNDPQQAWFNTGSGVFRTRNLLEERVIFTDWSDGVEETVHINVYAPPRGEVLLLDILGDLGGFAFRELSKPCENSFADAEGNRYVTCLNADYSDLDPNLVAVTPRGNWTGLTKGGLILSRDNCRSFQRLPMPYGLSTELDEVFRRIEQPNVNSGWVALSPDGRNMVWSVARGNRLPVSLVVASRDQGSSFRLVKVYDLEGRLRTEGGFKAFSDRMRSDLFYGFGEKGQVYVSTDGGVTFREVPLMSRPQKMIGDDKSGVIIKAAADDYCVSTKDNDDNSEESGAYALDLPRKIDFAIVDCADPTEVRGESGKSGVFYVAAGAKGLWKLTFVNDGLFGEGKTQPDFGKMADPGADSGRNTQAGLGEEMDPVQPCGKEGQQDNEKAFPGWSCLAERLGDAEDSFYHLGLGLLRPDGDYFAEEKALYVSGNIKGVYGFYRSFDQGRSFEKINNPQQCFGDINSIDGDKRVFGRFFIGTGSRGVLYGEPAEEG